MDRKKNIQVEAKGKVFQKGNRNWIHSFMFPKGCILILLLLAVMVWYGFYATHTKEVADSDDREYASIARNIVNGKGIVRNFIYPVDINFFDKLPVPEFLHPPGYPLLIAGFFKLFGISNLTALLPSYISYFALLILFFHFANSYLGMKTAAIATVVLIFNKEILNFSLVALSESVYILFFFLFFTLFVKADSLKAIFIAGLLLGMSHLIRENIYPFVIPLVIYLYFYPPLTRWKKMVLFIIGFLIPLVPNIIRSLLETGSPFFSYGKFTLMAYTEKYPWLNVYRGIENPSLIEFLIEEPSQFFFKYLSNFVNTLEQILSVSNSFVLAFFLAELFFWKISPEWKRIKMLLLFLLISQVFFISLFTFTHRFFVPFLPMMILFASQSFIRLSEDLVSAIKVRWGKKILFFMVLVFYVFFMMSTVHTIISPNKLSALDFKTPQYGFLLPKEEADQLNEFLRSELKDSDVVWTDLPEVLEWEGDRLCGWLPTRIQSIYEIQKKVPVDAILLTSLRTPHKMEEEWRYLLFSEHSLPLYRNVKLYKGRLLFAKLLIRDGKE